MRSFFKGEVQGPTQPMNKVEDGSGVRGDHRLHHQLAVRVHYRHRNRALVDIEAQVLHTFHRVFLSSARLTAQAQQPQPTRKGRPFIMRGPRLWPTRAPVIEVLPTERGWRKKPRPDSFPPRRTR